MSRYIKADAYRAKWADIFDSAYGDSCCEMFKKSIDEQPTADVPQWIPCSERLPYSQEDVLCDDDGRVTIGYYTDEEVGWHDTHSYRIYPTAWMPLPEPWKGEADDKGND